MSDKSRERAGAPAVDASSATDAVIRMTHVLEAPREVVWSAFTDPKHVVQWYGGKGFENTVCEMDVRPGGHWRHVMTTPDGSRHSLHFVFVEVVRPEKLSWRTERGQDGEPAGFNTITLEERGDETRVTFVCRFGSLAERDLAMRWGFATVLREGVDRMAGVLATLV